MKGDIEMVLKYASLWALRFLAERDSTIFCANFQTIPTLGEIDCSQSDILCTEKTCDAMSVQYQKLDRISLYWPPPLLNLYPPGEQSGFLCQICHRPQSYLVNPSSISSSKPASGPQLSQWLELLRHIYR